MTPPTHHPSRARRLMTTASGPPDHDVVVVGARCAGAATAMLLARAGRSVLVVEKASYGSDTRSTHALTRPAVGLLGSWGLLDAVRRAATPTVRRVVYHYGDDVVTVPLRPVGDIDGLYAPRRTVLDRLLVDAAVAAGAQVRHDTAVRGLTADPGGRICGVVLDDGTVVRSRLVVGADGARSSVARHVAAAVTHRAAACSATVYGYVPGLDDDAYHNHFRPGRAAGLIPTNDGLANVWVTLPEGRLRGAERHDAATVFHDGLAATAPLLAEAVRRHGLASGLRTFPGVRGGLRRPWGAGWALVGDASYLSDPVSAHGMTDALIGAELLAAAVLRVDGGVDERAALADYAAQRTWLARPMMAAVAHMAGFRWTLSSLQRAHMDASAAMRQEWTTLVELRRSGRGPLPVTRSAGTGSWGVDARRPVVPYPAAASRSSAA